MNITEKVAYIKGLMDGLELEAAKPETKILVAMVDLLDDMGMSIGELEEEFDEMADQLDAIDEDLGVLEEEFCEECCGDDCECGCCCDEDCDEEVFYEVACPTCKEKVCLSEPVLLDGKMDCPNCGENLEFDFDDIQDTTCECGDQEK